MSEEENNIQVPTRPEDQKNLQKALDGVVDAMTRISGEQDYINETLKELEQQYGVPKKVLRQVAKTREKDEYKEKSEEVGTFEYLYEALYGSDEEEESTFGRE